MILTDALFSSCYLLLIYLVACLFQAQVRAHLQRLHVVRPCRPSMPDWNQGPIDSSTCTAPHMKKYAVLQRSENRNVDRYAALVNTLSRGETWRSVSRDATPTCSTGHLVAPTFTFSDEGTIPFPSPIIHHSELVFEMGETGRGKDRKFIRHYQQSKSNTTFGIFIIPVSPTNNPPGKPPHILNLFI